MKKLKGGALVFVLVVSLIGGIMASLFLMQFDLSIKERDFYLRNYRMEKNAESGIAFVMAAGEQLAYNEFRELDFGQHSGDQIAVQRKFWGMYDVALSKVNSGNKSLVKSAIIGYEDQNNKTGLYVADLSQPISICGDAHLDGDTYLPEKGIKRAYIEGQNYSGSKLVYGRTLKSNKELPQLAESTLNYIERYLNGNFSQEDSIVDIRSLESDSISNSFNNRTLILTSNVQIVLKDIQLKGNIMVYSPIGIHIQKGSQLQNIILFSKIIEIDQPDLSYFQAFSNETILVKKNTHLMYPSTLCLLAEGSNPNSDEHKTELRVEEEATINGSLVAFKTNKNPKGHILVVTEQKTVIKGEVYTNDYAQIMGLVNGSVHCKKTFLKTTSSVYENYLLGTQIDGNKKPNGFCGIQLKNNNYHPSKITYAE